MIVPNVSVEEINSAPILNFTSSNSNGSIEIQINSGKELKGEFLIVNALGQQIKKTAAEIKSGSNNYSMNHQLNAGLYFVVLSTDDGKVYQSKVVVAK